MASIGTQSFQRILKAAQARWPGVQWDAEAFERHLAGQTPQFSADLYLAGAAGQRLASAWDAIQKRLGPPCRRMLHRQPLFHYSLDDLWADIVTRMMEDEPALEPLPDGRRPARIIRFRGRVPLLHYLVVIGKGLLIERLRSPAPPVAAEEDDFLDARNLPALSPEARQQERELCRLMKARLRETYERLPIEQQFLITMVHQRGMPQKQAGSLLNCSAFKTTRLLAGAMGRLRAALAETPGFPWTPILSSSWDKAQRLNWSAALLEQRQRSAALRPPLPAGTTAKDA